jgi:hypothetical protein
MTKNKSIDVMALLSRFNMPSNLNILTEEELNERKDAMLAKAQAKRDRRSGKGK